MTNKDTDKKEFENLHNILLDGIYYTMNILVEEGNFGSVSTDGNDADGYYIYIYIIDGHIISSLDRVLNVTYLTILIHGSKWYTQTYGTEVAISLCIIVHPKLKYFVPDCVDDFPGLFCAKYHHNYFSMKGMINIFGLLHGDILDKTIKLDKF